MSKADADGGAGGGGGGRRQNNKPGTKAGKKSSAQSSDEDWGAYGRARRDEKLERWMRGSGEVSDVPEDNQ